MFFSYTYDLTQTLQYNMSYIDRTFSTQKYECCSGCKTQKDQSDIKLDGNSSVSDGCENIEGDVPTKTTATEDESLKKRKEPRKCNKCLKNYKRHHFVTTRSKPYPNFVWNMHMLNGVEDIVHPDWLLYITHGFIGQCSILLQAR